MSGPRTTCAACSRRPTAARSWTKVLYENPQTGAVDLVMDPSDPNTLYAAMWQRQRRKWADPRTEPGFTHSGVWKTTDAGRTWKRLEGGLPPGASLGRIGLDVARSNPKVVYAFVDNYARGDKAPPNTRNPYGVLIEYYPIGNEMYRSNDKGATWTKTSGQDDQQQLYMRNLSSSYGWVFGNIRVDPRDENTVYTLALGVSVSHDAGKTFGRIGAPPGCAGGAAGGAGAAVPAVAGATPRLAGRPRRRARRRQPRDVARSEGPELHALGNDGGFRVSTRCRRDLDARGHSIEHVLRHGVRHGHAVPRLRVGPGSRQLPRRRGRAPGRRGAQAGAFEGAPGGEGSTHAIDPPTRTSSIRRARTARSRGAISAPRRSGAAAGAAAAAATRRTSSRRRRPATIATARPVAGADDPVAARSEHALLRTPVSLPLARSRGHVGEAHAGFQRRRQEAARRSAVSDRDLDLGVAEEGRTIYTGTDDGQLHVSIDAGKEWTDLTARLPTAQVGGEGAGVAVPGRHGLSGQQGRYDDDFAVYLFKSTDYGRRGRASPGICRPAR